MNITVECKTRAEGSKPRALRREGLIPAALYGHDGSNSVSLTIPTKEAQMLLRKAAINNTLIDIKVPDMSWNGKALIREVQAHPWKRTLNHISFFTVSAKQTVEIVVPVILTGNAVGTKEGGIVEQIMTELQISCFAGNIPESIKIDVTNFKIGDILHVGEILLPEGATVLDDPDRTAISVVLPAKPASEESDGATEVIEQNVDTVKTES
ncbi:50S ribosomal protein L25/general stress protein Ctc [Waterburya agarophytonicola K14]|uniref:Large ribosomal subunit protein bL25 n=1 Tax=Waterburya agarophytonicola KI4 TaxID=2874699 RepID=A0A964FEE9_9CYAN|nr:50S ribosomal protein L25/general stress protein Ctc [Waterburya agarophytonicola]MCC0175797.1 50S ribosomal protein L25/general stress protein Ctc [Waterburya agarophytonicola KI4]